MVPFLRILLIQGYHSFKYTIHLRLLHFELSFVITLQGPGATDQIADYQSPGHIRLQQPGAGETYQNPWYPGLWTIR